MQRRNRRTQRLSAWRAARRIMERETFADGALAAAWVDTLPAVPVSSELRRSLWSQCAANVAAGMRTFVVWSAGEPIGWTDEHGALVAPDMATADAWHAAIVRDAS